jgi:hypothetical protein
MLTGIKPNTAIKQNAATPKASVTSTSEKAEFLYLRDLMADKHGQRRLWYQVVPPRDYLRLG